MKKLFFLFLMFAGIGFCADNSLELAPNQEIIDRTIAANIIKVQLSNTEKFSR